MPSRIETPAPVNGVRVLVGVGTLALPAVLFTAALLVKWLVPSTAVSRSQVMYDFIGIGLAWGALLSVFTTPMVILFTRRYRRDVSDRSRLGLYLLSALSLLPLGMLLLYMAGLSYL